MNFDVRDALMMAERRCGGRRLFGGGRKARAADDTCLSPTIWAHLQGVQRRSADFATQRIFFCLPLHALILPSWRLLTRWVLVASCCVRF
jgi:hypothetical protein